MIDLERTFGKYTISIGTSVALEGLFEAAGHQGGTAPPFHEYEAIIANFKTLVRNFLSSFKSADLETLTPTYLYQAFMGELILMGNLIEENSGGRIKLYVYYNTYERVSRSFKKATFKSKYTAKQTQLMVLEQSLYERVVANVSMMKIPFLLEVTQRHIESGRRHNLMISHIPSDLLLCTKHCDLLESHTGKIKKHRQFYTKLKNASDIIPFNKYTIQIFGDSSGTIVPMASPLINEVREICKKTHTTSITGDLRFYKLMRTHGSTTLSQLINSMK